MKKIIRFLCVVLFGGLLFGCQPSQTTQSANQTTQTTQQQKVIYTTFYPVYELTKRVVGDKMAVKMIIDGNQEAHGFELTPQVMKDVQQADALIYNGAGMEEFIDDLKSSLKQTATTVDLSQGLTLLTTGDGVTESKQSVNPHTWLSVKNAMVMLRTIYDAVVTIDQQNKAYYTSNLEKATQELEALHKEFELAVAAVKREVKYFVVSHAAFNYLAYDYNLRQVAVTGISPEEEPSAQQLKKIADFVKENRISTIFFEGKATPKVAKTLADNTKTKTEVLYTMETLSPGEMAKGYVALMRHNLKVLVDSFDE